MLYSNKSLKNKLQVLSSDFRIDKVSQWRMLVKLHLPKEQNWKVTPVSVSEET